MAGEWRLCPRCVQQAKSELEEGYGELPEEEYNELRQRVNNPYTNFQTLRVVYELDVGISDEGESYLYFDLGAGCEGCGLSESVVFDSRKEGSG